MLTRESTCGFGEKGALKEGAEAGIDPGLKDPETSILPPQDSASVPMTGLKARVSPD